MKRCPTCGLTLDDSQTFCTNDGTPLVADKSSYDPGATLVSPPPGALPTAQPPQFPPQGQQTAWQPTAQPTAPPMYGALADLNQPTGARPSKFVPGLIGGVVAGILSLFPLYWLFVTSLSPQQFILKVPPDLVPSSLTLANYQRLFDTTPAC